ncbi:FAD dependent oxidoreductase [Xylariomycetidae sp. FL2044]|nr:FAD dependent oxidoreductase [Xylariomycetidae sp. FL2044]
MTTNLQLLFPVPNPTVPYWRTQPHALDSHRSTPDLPERQDVVVIGAGFAGAALAYYLMRDPAYARKRVTVLEAREACSGATGRNGGHLRPDVFAGIAAHRQTHGMAAANEIGRFELTNAEAFADLVESEGIDCDLKKVTSFDAYADPEWAAQAKQAFDEMRGAGCETLDKVKYYGSAEEAERVTGIRGARAAFTFPAATVWPYKAIMHILSVAVSRGVNLQTHTPVHRISVAADDEGYWTLSTPRGATKAREVVFATNAYTAGLLPQYEDLIYPARGTVCRLVPSSGVPPEAAAAAKPPGSGAILGDGISGVDWYYSFRPDGSLITGGGRKSFMDKRELSYGNYDDSTLMEPTAKFFEGLPERSYVGWEEAKMEVDRVWTGIMGYSKDSCPHIGKVPGKPGQFICAGFNGHGMPNVLLCSKGLAKMMAEGCPFSESGIPALYETSAERVEKLSQS